MAARNKARMMKMGLGMALFAMVMVTDATAQLGNPFAPSSAMDTLSGGSVGSGSSGVGGIALQRARNVGGGSSRRDAPRQRRRSRGKEGEDDEKGGRAVNAPVVPQPIRRIIKKKIRVIKGTRVIDAVTGELLDDARIVMVDEEEKDQYFDDGTHGDLTAEDGEYALVDVTREHLGQSNQRIKERLIQALNEAEQLDPIQFYGYSLLSIGARSQPVRGHRWKIVPDGGLGYKLTVVNMDEELVVPQFREEERRKDNVIADRSRKDGWAYRFLDEYRIEPGNLGGKFYTMYIPKPPAPPSVPPPTAAGWEPFGSPTVPDTSNFQGRAERKAGGGGGGGGGGGEK